MIHSMFDLTGRTALVTGGAGHLGRPMTRALAEAGAAVHILGRSRERMEAFASELSRDGLQIFTHVVDMVDAAGIRQFCSHFHDENERLDILVNNAYTGSGGTIETTGIADYEKTYSVNVTMPMLMMQTLKSVLLEAVKRAGSASVINIASMYGTVSPDPRIYLDSGSNNPPNYGPAKAAVIQMTRYLACHWAPEGIRANALSPGPFPPPSLPDEHPEFYARLVARVPMKRIGQATELAGAVLFLASDASSFVTGANIAVDGGWTSW